MIRGERLEAMALALPVEEVGVGGTTDVDCCSHVGWSSTRGEFHGSDRYQAIRMEEGQRPKHDAVDQAEDGSGRSDPDGQRHDRGKRESRTAQELAERKS